MNKLKRHLHPQSTQAGFTIIESLMALMVVSILMVALSPVVVLSVATRVQARRVELATQAARTYIDGVRADIILDPPISNDKFKDINAPEATGTLTCGQNFQGYVISDYCQEPSGQVDAVTTSKKVCADDQCSSTTTAPNINVTTLYCIDLDDTAGCSKDSTTDMIVQAVGYHPQANDNDSQVNYVRAEEGYKLGIRVYRASAFKETGDLEKSDDDNNSKQAAAAGVTLGKKSKQPLLEITTAVAPQNPNFDRLQELIE